METRPVKIADAVHGTVQLSALETRLLDSSAFQRLRGIKHLGLASLVFPGADYSRLAHGIGTCHVTGRILTALRELDPTISESEVQLYRAAALLHDIGHYPFSHTFELALKDFHQRTSILVPEGGRESGDPDEGILMHEDVGAEVIRTDPDLLGILKSADIDPEEVTRIITRVGEPPKFTNLVSSDLDADRIDYLLRTALHTGLPYGNVDLDYLLTQIRLDDQGSICYTGKGMRAAEHLLLSRFYDYAQVSFHKTVAALELVLNEAIGALLHANLINCSGKQIQEMIASGRWTSFDDAHVLDTMRRAVADGVLEEIQTRYCRAVIDRRPPKLLYELETFGGASDKERIKMLTKVAKEKQKEWEEEFGTRIWVWSRGVNFTKIGPHLSLSQHQEEEDETYDRIKQAVLILDGEATTAVPIQEVRRSLLGVLSSQSLEGLRVYALSDIEDDKIAALRGRVRGRMSEFS